MKVSLVPDITATVSAILAGEAKVFAKVRTGVHSDVQDQQTLYEHQDVGVLYQQKGTLWLWFISVTIELRLIEF